MRRVQLDYFISGRVQHTRSRIHGLAATLREIFRCICHVTLIFQFHARFFLGYEETSSIEEVETTRDGRSVDQGKRGGT